MAIEALTECGAVSAALQAEHAAIESALQTLGDAMLAGAKPESLAKIMDMVVEFCLCHFEAEDQLFAGGEHGQVHAGAHKTLLAKFRAVRDSIGEGQPEGTLDAADLLNDFHNHVTHFDRASHAILLQQNIDRKTGDTYQQLNELRRVARTGNIAPADSLVGKRPGNAERV
jgi:hemerythrin